MATETETAAAPTLGPAKPKTQSKSRNRKRAPKACLSCRARKVRCDVSQRGRPCMNCYLDSETCVVTGRASRLRPQRKENVQASYPPYNDKEEPRTTETVTKSRAETNPRPATSTDPGLPSQPREHAAQHPHGHDDSHRQVSPRPERPKADETSHSSSSPSSSSSCSCHHGRTPDPFISTFGTSNDTFNARPAAAPAPQWNGEHSLGMGLVSDVTYSYYPFLTVSNISEVLAQDLNFLELQGCLRIPTRAILDEFMQQYFLHVHPMLPMLNEGDFWDMYGGGGGGTFSSSSEEAPVTGTMSLLVLQSMLFASCTFVSRQSIQALGFPTIRAARASLHRRCKLLYDFDTESSPVAISQAALQLSTWYPPAAPGFRKPNTAWLAIAIQHAKTAEAHHYASISHSNTSTSTSTQTAAAVKKKNRLKRLWWCCVIRDRIMGLSVRRSIQITRSHFDFDSGGTGTGVLGFADLADEVDRSRVYDPDTKRCLAEILEQLVELYVLLTDVLVLVFPLDDSPGWGRPMSSEEQDKVREHKVALRRWYKGATLRFPPFGGGPVARKTGGGKNSQHDSVILYTNLMYMYYHSARVVLSHHEVLHLAVTAAAPSFSTIPSSDLVVIGENRHELQDAASGVTECLKELIHLRLARWLPISAVACTALPLVLHILDVKLSPSSHNQKDANSSSVMKQHRLNILIEAMKTYQPQYNGVDMISETIRHIVNLAQLDPPGGSSNDSGEDNNNSSSSRHRKEGEASANNNKNNNDDDDEGSAPHISDWTDILATHPSSYLRLALTMDLSLSKGRLPEDSDFPIGLRGLFTSGMNPLRTRLENNNRFHNEADAQVAAAAAAVAAAADEKGASIQSFRGALFPDASHHHHHFATSTFAPLSPHAMGAAVSHLDPHQHQHQQQHQHQHRFSQAATAASAFNVGSSTVSATQFGVEGASPSVFSLQPGTVTALPSDSETDSPDSAAAVGAENMMNQPNFKDDNDDDNNNNNNIGSSCGFSSDEALSPRQGSQAGGEGAGARDCDRDRLAPSEGLDGLAADEVEQVGFDGMYIDHDDEYGAESDHAGHGCQGRMTGEGEDEGDWMMVDGVWGDDDSSGQDTAQVLLDALKKGDMGGLMAG